MKQPDMDPDELQKAAEVATFGKIGLLASRHQAHERNIVRHKDWRFPTMRHNREEVIKRTIQEFELLDRLVANLTSEEWNRLLHRFESKDPWTVKDALAHITHWKADMVRKARKRPRPVEEKGLNWTDGNHLVYERWRDRSPQDVLAWHRQVQEDIRVALQDAPERWFSDRERRPEWPFDLDGHSSYHRIKDIEHALKKSAK